MIGCGCGCGCNGLSSFQPIVRLIRAFRGFRCKSRSMHSIKLKGAATFVRTANQRSTDSLSQPFFIEPRNFWSAFESDIEIRTRATDTGSTVLLQNMPSGVNPKNNHKEWLKLFLRCANLCLFFCLFLSFGTENYFIDQQDLNSDCWSRRQRRWPLDHHHGPNDRYFYQIDFVGGF